MSRITKMDAATPLPDFDEVRRAIEKAGRDAMNQDTENRLDMFKRAIREVLEIRADAMRSGIYFKDPEVKLKAYETRSRAERRIAQFLMAMDEAGLRDPGHPKKGEKGRKASAPSGLPTLTDLGVDRRQSQDWQKLARMSDAEFEAWLETEKSQRRSRRRKGPVDYRSTRSQTNMTSSPSPSSQHCARACANTAACSLRSLSGGSRPSTGNTAQRRAKRKASRDATATLRIYAQLKKKCGPMCAPSTNTAGRTPSP
jgi:hypothetical protein